jgi:acyl-CoA synthetase (AMP-forming)/AMP-acid ligase II
VHFYEDFSLTESLSAARILADARAFASGLPAPRCDGECAILSLPNHPSFVISYFGCLIRGYVPVPLAVPELTRVSEYGDTLERVRQVTEARVFLSTREGLQRARGISFSFAREATAVGAGPGYVEADLRPEAPCLIQFSSGSTGAPKGVVLTHENLIANLAQIRKGMRAGPEDVGCSWLPFYHDMGWIGGLLSPLEAGYPVHVLSPFDFVAAPERWLRLASRVRATLILGPDFTYRLCVRRVSERNAASLDLKSVRLALSGAEPVNAETCRKFAIRFAASGFRESAFFPVYGLAENSLAVTFPEPGSGIRTLMHEGIEVASCGRPLPGVSLRVVDEQGRGLGEGCVGSIEIRSPSVTQGYFQNAEATGELFREGWMRTGDLGLLDRGELFIVGREKDLIILNGRNLHPGDIERRALEVPGFRFGRCAAVSVPEKSDGESAGESVRLVAECYEILPWRRTRLRRLLAARASEITPIPVEHVALVPHCTIPRTSSGKTRRFELRRMILGGLVTKVDGHFLKIWLAGRVEIASAVAKLVFDRLLSRLRRRRLEALLEQHLARGLAEALGNPRLNPEARRSFADYHVDSLALVRLHAALRREFGPVELHELVGLANLRELGAHLMRFHRAGVEEWRRSHGNDRRAGSAIAGDVPNDIFDTLEDFQPQRYRLEHSRGPGQALEPARALPDDLPSELRGSDRGAAPPL